MRRRGNRVHMALVVRAWTGTGAVEPLRANAMPMLASREESRRTASERVRNVMAGNSDGTASPPTLTLFSAKSDLSAHLVETDASITRGMHPLTILTPRFGCCTSAPPFSSFGRRTSRPPTPITARKRRLSLFGRHTTIAPPFPLFLNDTTTNRCVVRRVFLLR